VRAQTGEGDRDAAAIDAVLEVLGIDVKSLRPDGIPVSESRALVRASGFDFALMDVGQALGARCCCCCCCGGGGASHVLLRDVSLPPCPKPSVESDGEFVRCDT
jgi:hypothetical protein